MSESMNELINGTINDTEIFAVYYLRLLHNLWDSVKPAESSRQNHMLERNIVTDITALF